MVVDASAVLAILLREDDAQVYARRLATATDAVISPVNYWEVLIRMTGLFGAPGRVIADRYLSEASITIMPIGSDIAKMAVTASERYGRGTPAKLNLGDTFAYALAKEEGAPLLFKGDDFTKTDIVNALTGQPGPA